MWCQRRRSSAGGPDVRGHYQPRLLRGDFRLASRHAWAAGKVRRTNQHAMPAAGRRTGRGAARGSARRPSSGEAHAWHRQSRAMPARGVRVPRLVGGPISRRNVAMMPVQRGGSGSNPTRLPREAGGKRWRYGMAVHVTPVALARVSLSRKMFASLYKSAQRGGNSATRDEEAQVRGEYRERNRPSCAQEQREEKVRVCRFWELRHLRRAPAPGMWQNQTCKNGARQSCGQA